jgi:hypothetical protein
MPDDGGSAVHPDESGSSISVHDGLVRLKDWLEPLLQDLRAGDHVHAGYPYAADTLPARSCGNGGNVDEPSSDAR